MSNLVFRSIWFENFKSFYGPHEFKLNLPAGLYYISGRNKLNPELGANGVGKSTLWDALKWCLTGKTGRDNRPANSVVPWDSKKGITQVTTEWSRGKQKHHLTRSRNPNDLILDGKTVTQTEVDAALGISEEMFNRTILLSQFGTMFLDLRPEQQSQMFNEALSLDLWLKASQSANQKQKTTNGQLVGCRVELSKLDGRRTELEKQLERETKAQASFASDLSEQQSRLKKRLSAKEAALQDFLTENPVPAAPGSPVARKSGQPAIGPRETAINALETAWARLGREAKDLQVEAGNVESDIKTTQRELKQYSDAISGNKACPACGQTAPLAHLKSKAKFHEHAIAEKQQIKDKLDKHLKIKVSGFLEAERMLKEQRKLLSNQSVLENDVELAKRELHRFRQQDNPHDQAIKNMSKSLRKIETDKENISKQQDDLTYQAGVCEYWVGAFKEIRLSLIDAALLELEMAVTRHVEALGLEGWQVKFATEKVKASGDVSTTFTVLLLPPDQEEPIKFESYSGGESQRLQLAVSFGLSEVILARAGINPSIEVYDEPTRGLSSDGVDDLLEHLAQRAEDLDRCIFVVEHHSLERGMFRSMITVMKDEYGSHILEGT